MLLCNQRMAKKKFVMAYTPFGSISQSRVFYRGDSSEFRYGFGSQERDDEIYGKGNSYTAEFWQYDSRLGRRWNIDPVVKPYESPYASFANNPIWFADPSGADTTVYIFSFKNVFTNSQGQKESKDDFSPTELIEIKKVMEDIFKNNAFNLNFEIISEEEAMSKELDKTDALIGMKAFGRYQGYTSIYDDFTYNRNENYVSRFHVENDSRNYNIESYYLHGYIASHEVLHQYLHKANLTFYPNFRLPSHNNSTPNLNMDKHNVIRLLCNTHVPNELQIGEKILETHRILMLNFIKFELGR
jgi:hypothetical protein